MKAIAKELNQKLKKVGLKVTPQRQAILEAVYQLGNHPTADNILEYIRNRHPNIATGTVYKILDVLVDKGLIKRVKTDKDNMRYDGIVEIHHHLYSANSERIEDFMDEEIDLLLEQFFSKKGIPGFQINEIRLQINGIFLNRKKDMNK